MSAPAPVERIAALHERIAPGLAGGPAWARRRGHALGALVARGLPDRRDENWKYLDHARIAEYRFDALARAVVDTSALAARQLAITGARLIVLADGRYERGLSDHSGVAGLDVLDLGAMLEQEPEAALALLRNPGEDADDRYALLADAFAARGVALRVAPGAKIAEPIYLLHVATAAEPAVHQSRLVVHAGARSQFTLVEHFVALGEAASFGNLAAELALGEGSTMTHLRLHQHSAASAQVETWVARLGAGSQYAQHLLALGGRLLRSNLRLVLEGARAACRLDGLFLVDGDRQVDLLTRVTHQGAGTATTQDYRGVATGRGRGAFNGRITVQRTARGANASQSSRNLLLTPLAEINARPQLEIQVDEVQCRHGATIGTLDAGQLFYLVSRGIEPAAARAILTYAFCQDLVGRISLAPLRAAAESLVATALPDRELIRELA
jgi:Fe-S cluster assembly protein SufD